MTTWWVRPDASHGVTRNGTSYETAWGGWSEIIWGIGGVIGGDTLYVCGTHNIYASILVGNHGAIVGNETIIRGDYTPNPGTLNFFGSTNITTRNNTVIVNLNIVQGTGAGIFINGHSNVLLDGLVFKGAANIPSINCSTAMGTITKDIHVKNCVFNSVGYALRWLATTASATNATLNGLICEYNTVIHNANNSGSVGGFEVRMEVGVDPACFAQNIRFSRNNVSGPGRAFVVASGGGPPPAENKFTSVTIENNTVSDVFTGITLYGSTTNNFIRKNIVRNTAGLSGGLDMMSVGSATIEENDFYGHTSTGVDGNSAIIGDLCNNVTVVRNKFGGAVGNNSNINSGAALMLNACNNVDVIGNTLYDSRYGLWVNDNASYDGFTNLTVDNNTIKAKEVLVYLRKISGSPANIAELTLKNNLLVGQSGGALDLINDWSGVPDEDYTWRWNTISAGFSFGANGGTTYPGLTADGKLLPTSPLLGAGVHTEYKRDLDNKQFYNPPSIGCYEYERPRISRN